MAYRARKYTMAQNKELEFQTLDTLVNSEVPLTVEQIQMENISLAGYTPQKMSRVLNELVEKGFVFKTKSKEKKRMIYMAAQKMQEQGYNLNEVVC